MYSVNVAALLIELPMEPVNTQFSHTFLEAKISIISLTPVEPFREKVRFRQVLVEALHVNTT